MCRFVRAAAGPATKRVRINITMPVSFKLPRGQLRVAAAAAVAAGQQSQSQQQQLATCNLQQLQLAVVIWAERAWPEPMGVAGVMLNCQHPLGECVCNMSWQVHNLICLLPTLGATRRKIHYVKCYIVNFP